MIIVFIGPPGAGKGTQASRLSRVLGIPHIGSGDMLRAVRAQDTALGREARRYMDAGGLVPDEVTVRIVEERLGRPDAAAGAILDGFPRTVAQAERLDALLAHRPGSDDRAVDAAVYMQASREVVLERMKGRWICRQCATVYQVPSVPPAEIGRCDACGAELYQRSDETPEVQARRFEVYERDTRPLVDYYRARGVLAPIDGEQPVDDVARDVLAAIRALGGPTPDAPPAPGAAMAPAAGA